MSLHLPNGAARLINTNNFAANTDFNSISFAGAGYQISGNAIDLLSGVTGDFSTSPGTSQLYMDLVFQADATFNIGMGGTVDLNGSVSESGGSFT